MRKLIACAALALALAPLAQAQFTHQPFYEHSEALRHAHATTLMEVRLIAIETIADTGELPEELAEQAEALREHDLPRLAGTLADADANLLEELDAALAELEEAVTAEDLPAASTAAAGARQLALRARAALLPPGILEEPPVAAALISLLLLGEPGVAEGYEEAVEEELWEYPLGWASLQLAQELFGSIIAPMVAERSEEVEEAFAELDELMPEATPPEVLSGDPEDAEEPSHRIVGLLEGIADANLYRDREVGQLARHAAGQAGAACEAFAGNRDDLGLELTLAAGDSYEPLEGTIGMLASEAHERVEDALDAISSNGEGAQEACGELRGALEEIAGLFGG